MSMLTIWWVRIVMMRIEKMGRKWEGKKWEERKEGKRLKWVSFTKWLFPVPFLDSILKYSNSWIWWDRIHTLSFPPSLSHDHRSWSFRIRYTHSSSSSFSHSLIYEVIFLDILLSHYHLVLLSSLLRSRKWGREGETAGGVIIGFVVLPLFFSLFPLISLSSSSSDSRDLMMRVRE